MTLLVAFTGAATSILLGLGAGLSAVLVGLYLLREQHRPLVVPFVELWRRAIEKRSASVPWQRLRRLLSLLLQLILLALLLLALANPIPESESHPGRTTIFLVDVSPSMAASDDAKTGRTRLEIAKARLSNWIAKLGQRDRAVIVSLSARPRVETGFTSDRRVLERAVLRLSIQHSAADVARGLRLAREILPRGARGEVILVGDGAYPELGTAATRELELSFEPVGKVVAREAAPENVGISNFSARRYPSDPRRFEAQLELSSTARTSAEVEVALLAVDAQFQQGAPIEVKRTLVPPDGRLVIPLAELSGATEGVVAEVKRVDGGTDWLPADNRAQLLLLPLPPLRVLALGAPNQFLEAALLTETGLVASREAPGTPATKAEYDVVIHDGAPSPPRAGAALYLGVGQPDAPFPVRRGRKLQSFGFDRWKKDSPLFEAVDPYDVQVLEGHALLPGPTDTALAFSGQDAIVVMGERAEGRFIALGFDPRQSDFFLRAAWPLFVHNAIWELAPRASGEDGIALSPGREWHLRTPTSGAAARLTGPLGAPAQKVRRAAVTEQRTTVFGELAGFYELEQSGKSSHFFANYFDDAEARLQPGPSFGAPAATPAQPGTRSLPRPRPFRRERDLSPWLVLLACTALLSLSEWWSYHRRWTV